MDLSEIRSLVDRGQLLRGLDEAKRLADDPRQEPAVRVQALHLACRCAAGREMHTEGYGFAQRARGIAEGAGLEELAALSDHFAGYALVMAGDPSTAEAYILNALSATETYSSLQDRRPEALYNLGICYERMRRYEAAYRTYSQAAAGLERTGRLQQALQAFHNAAWVALRARQGDRAAQFLEEAGRLLNAGSGSHQADQLALEAALALHHGARERAVSLSEEVLLPGRKDVTPWASTLAAWVCCSVALEQGRPDLAAAMHTVSKTYAPLCRDTALMNIVSGLQAQIEAAGGPAAP